MAKPANIADARRRLTDADLTTEAGRADASEVIDWLSKQRSIPDDVQRLADATTEALFVEVMKLGRSPIDWSVPARQINWLWEGSIKAGNAILGALGGIVSATGEAHREFAEDIKPPAVRGIEESHAAGRAATEAAWPHLTDEQQAEARRKGLAPEQRGLTPGQPVTGPPRPPDEWLAQSVARQGQREAADRLEGLSPQAQALVARLAAAGVDDPEETAREILAGDPPPGEILGRVASALPDLPPEVLQELAEQFGGPGFIGVPDTHARTEQGPPGVSARREGMPESVWKARPRYRQGAQHRPLQWSSERIADLQRRLVKAGLLEGDFHYGWYDDATGGAYEMALSAANQRAIDVWDALDNLARDRAEELEDQRAQAMAGFQPAPFLPPDPAQLEQAARDGMVSYLGREPDDDELDVLAARLGVLERQAHRQQVELERRQHEAMVEQEFDQATAMPGEVVESSPIDVTGLRQVDPAHALMAEIRKRYAPERGHIEAVGEFADQDQNLMSTLLGMDSLMGGGR